MRPPQRSPTFSLLSEPTRSCLHPEASVTAWEGSPETPSLREGLKRFWDRKRAQRFPSPLGAPGLALHKPFPRRL